MKKKKMISIASVMLIAGIMSTSVFAASNYKSPVEAQNAEKFQIKEEILKERVASGTITQETADEILKAIEENAANCDGSGSAKIGQTYGVGFGSGNAMKNGSGRGAGNGRENCNGNGNGSGREQGFCINNQ